MEPIYSHKILNLFETPNEFYIQPVEQPNEALIIDRHTFLISLNGDFSINHLPSNATTCLIYGIIGIKYILSCPYLIVITEATVIGLKAGHSIYRLDRARLIPFDYNIEERQDIDHNLRNVYLTMLDSVLETPHFYFSYGYDLTNSMQRNFEKSDQSEIDKRFLWNGDMVSWFDRFSNYTVSLIHGFVSIKPLVETGSNWTLISRRSIKRAGTRFNRRGIDEDGNVANFVETEQILESGPNFASFVQIRGSIPVKWSQEADYRYKPAIKIDESTSSNSLAHHMNELVKIYSRISVVSLIDKRGHEGKLGHVFSQLMQHHQQPYHDFDFHAECSKMRWHRLEILLDRIEPEISNYGFFVFLNGKVVQKQTGVIRSNCIDSLDRTNVVQSMVANRVLKEQERLLKQTSPNLIGLDQSVFKNVWADNADTLSIQYAGTPALKTDFTRTGKRTWNGQIQDGINSLTRYVTNNFRDNYRQEALDYFLGYLESHPTSLHRYTAPTFFIGLILLTLTALYMFNISRS